MGAQKPRIGVWLFGAGGSIATHVMVGARAMRAGLAPRQGLVTDLPPFGSLDLVEPSDLVFGGHELRADLDALTSARQHATARGGLTPELVEAIADDLAAIGADLRPGCTAGLGEWAASLGVEVDVPADPAEECARMRGDIEGFASRHGLDRVVAVNLASTEPPIDAASGPDQVDDLLARPDLTPSIVFTAAALSAGCPVVNFTPSPALEIPALRDLALTRGIPHCGRDGKTGETLLKSVLAPMFLMRNLKVLSWESYNLLGNQDGRVLAHDQNRRSKVSGKSDLLAQILDYPHHHRVHIDYVPSLDDWKTAWNLIHFEGFLGVRMNLQFTWQGCDSALAAPLVLDLIRLADLAHRRGEAGPMLHTGAFFKAPPAGVLADFASQMDLLHRYAAGESEETRGPSGA